MFCAHFNFQDLPAEINTLCLYVQFLSRSFKSVQSVRSYLSGVKTLHAILDIDFPKDNIFQLNLLLRGISREKQYIPRQAEPIIPVILLDIYKHLNLLKQTDAVFWCIVLLMFISYGKKVQRDSRFCERF